jgi:glycogen operon protein
MLRSGQRRFGLAAHLYALRREGDQGIGDFTTLAAVAEGTARVGGITVGINPLHALSSEDRARASPYHPSDRRFLDPIYIDVAAVPDLTASADARAALASRTNEIGTLSSMAMVDYARVWEAKRGVLERCFAAFAQRAANDPLLLEFDAFVAAGGVSLQHFAIFEAIASRNPGVAWPQWDSGLRNPAAAGIAAFASREASRVRFALYLQWLADRQLAAAAQRARSAGLQLGLYRDLAVGSAPDGAEAWANPAGVLARGVSIGAPPDPFARGGQIWNLPPPIPRALIASGFSGFRELLAANMRHAGALRIDHAIGLTRLFWVPEGAAASEGAYVHYPLDEMLTVLAQESVRAQCAIVGEDLGTVPEGLSARLMAANVLSYRILWFEREGNAFRAPERFPPLATACASTHDLPTIAGWWSGADIAEQRTLGRLDPDTADAAMQARARDRRTLAAALNVDVDGGPIDPDAPCDARVAGAIHRHLARSASVLTLVQADDLAGETSALNLPGTDRERPNWRRKVSAEAGALWTTPVATASLPALTSLRTDASAAPGGR